MEKKKPLIILAGPTAVGKTDASIALAKATGGEIISADSIQIYRYMDIGSAKISEEEKQGIPHYLVDELYPDEEFNVVIFQKMALRAIEQIQKNGHIPILTGGTGFYIQSVLYGIDFDETETDRHFRQEMEAYARTRGAQALHNMLRQVDEKAAQSIHPNNIKRMIRALEYHRQTGQRISDHNEEQKQKESPYQAAYFVLNRDRSALYDRINRRVDQMIAQGLLKETERLLSLGYQRNLTSMQGLGYKEAAAYLNGELSYEEMFEQIKKNTRHFAKRQITWFKREPEAEWIQMEDYPDTKSLTADLLKRLRQKGIISE